MFATFVVMYMIRPREIHPTALPRARPSKTCRKTGFAPCALPRRTISPKHKTYNSVRMQRPRTVRSGASLCCPRPWSRAGRRDVAGREPVPGALTPPPAAVTGGKRAASFPGAVPARQGKPHPFSAGTGARDPRTTGGSIREGRCSSGRPAAGGRGQG